MPQVCKCIWIHFTTPLITSPSVINYSHSHQDDLLCGNKTSATAGRRKNFRYEISDRLSQRKIYIEVILTVAILLVLGIFAIVATTCCSVKKKREDVRQSKAFGLHSMRPDWRFIGLWATFQSLWQQLICPNLPHS